MANAWYIRENATSPVRGPFTPAQLTELAQKGRLGAGYHLKRSGDPAGEEWRPVTKYKALAQHIPAASRPNPPRNSPRASAYPPRSPASPPAASPSRLRKLNWIVIGPSALALVLLVVVIVLLAGGDASNSGKDPALVESTADSLPAAQPLTAREIAAQVRLGVVQVKTNLANGSGIVWNDTVVITNHHVVEGAAWVRIETPAAEGTFDATVLSEDAATDLAILRIPAGLGVVPIEPADFGSLRVGEDVYAIGHPLGLSQTMTRGIISALPPIRAGSVVRNDLVQTDAAISPGNSGGPLVDSQGKLIGVNTLAISGGRAQALNFAIHVDEVRRFLHSLATATQPGVAVPQDHERLAQLAAQERMNPVLPSKRELPGVFRRGPKGVLVEDCIVMSRGKAELTDGECLHFHAAEQITDAELVHLKNLTALTTLNLNFCEQITDTGLAHLKNLTALTTLSLALCKQITDAGLAHLKGLAALTMLDLIGCDQITDVGLAHLKGLTALTKLFLGGCEQITDTGLAHLKGLTALTELYLSGCDKITDAGLAHLKNLTALTTLTLTSFKQITDTGLAHLKGLTALTELYLSGCEQITDAGLVHLKGLTALTMLYLWGCEQITDAGLVHLKGLTALTELELRDCIQITDAGLAHLKNLAALTMLDLRGCDQITDAGVAELRRAVPALWIKR